MTEAQIGISIAVVVACMVCVIALLIAWTNVDDHHQATTRHCIAKGLTVPECLRFKEMP
jgi:hypothetical protein